VLLGFLPCRAKVLEFFTLSVCVLFGFISSVPLSLFLDIFSSFFVKTFFHFEVENIVGLFYTGMTFRSVWK
jgi:hypothetical protein